MADRAEIVAELEALEVHCRGPVMTVAARGRWLTDWCGDLGEFPIEQIVAAFRDWRQLGNTKLPIAGQIIPLIRAKVRGPSGSKSGLPQAWRPPSDAEYGAATLAEKIRHCRILASRAQFDAGPMYHGALTWGAGRPLESSEMPYHWHELTRQAAGHAAEAKRLDVIRREFEGRGQ